jgi:hypothetical protein
MTRKDFQLIADAVKRLQVFSNSGSDEISLGLVAKELADALATTNPNFDRARFLTACGVN